MTEDADTIAAWNAELKLGNVDMDNVVTIIDTHRILEYYANISAGKIDAFSENATLADRLYFESTDIDGDQKITIQDAYLTLLYYANNVAGNTVTWEELLDA